jgi:hypothetical protein
VLGQPGLNTTKVEEMFAFKLGNCFFLDVEAFKTNGARQRWVSRKFFELGKIVNN